MQGQMRILEKDQQNNDYQEALIHFRHYSRNNEIEERKEGYSSSKRSSMQIIQPDYITIRVKKSNKLQKGGAFDQSYCRTIEEVPHYNQIEPWPQEWEEKFKQFIQPSKVVITMNQQQQQNDNVENLNICGTLYMIFKFHLKSQISSKSKDIMKSIINKAQGNENLLISQQLLPILLQQIPDSEFEQRVTPILLFPKNSMTIFDFLKVWFDESHQNQLEQPQLDYLLILSIIFDLNILTLDLQNQINMYSDSSKMIDISKTSIDNKEEIRTTPVIIIKQFSATSVNVYNTLECDSIIEDKLLKEQVDINNINELQKLVNNNDINYNTFSSTTKVKNLKRLYDSYFKTKNPLESIIMVTYINIILQIISLINKDQPDKKRKIQKLWELFKQPFLPFPENQNSGSVVSSFYIKSQSFNNNYNPQANNFRDEIEQLQKNPNVTVDLLIQFINSYEQKNVQFRQIAYEYEMKQITKEYGNHLESKLIAEYFEKKFYAEGIIDKSRFPGWVHKNFGTYILLPHEYIHLKKVPVKQKTLSFWDRLIKMIKGCFSFCLCVNDQDDNPNVKHQRNKQLSDSQYYENSVELNQSYETEQESLKPTNETFRFIVQDYEKYLSDYSQMIRSFTSGSIDFNNQPKESYNNEGQTYSYQETISQRVQTESVLNMRDQRNDEGSLPQENLFKEKQQPQQKQEQPIFEQNLVYQFRNEQEKNPKLCQCGRHTEIFYKNIRDCKNCFSKRAQLYI